MATFQSFRSTRFRYLFIALFALYTILSIAVIALGFMIKAPDALKGTLPGRVYTMATLFRVFGGLAAISMGATASIAWSIQKSGRTFLYLFLLGIPAFLFQGGAGIIDGVCSTQLAEGLTTPHALVGAAALGTFAALASLGGAIFLGLNRRSMSELAQPRGAMPAPNGHFEPLYDDLELEEEPRSGR